LTLVVDSSVAVKWLVTENDSDRALALSASHESLIAPDLIQAETANALWKKVKREEIAAEEALQRLNVEPLLNAVFPTPPLLPIALKLALTYDRTVYDSVYLALALGRDCHVVTADKRFLNAIRATDARDLVLDLVEVAG
jgi:predicted nucleic acid-binding protein